MRHEGIFSNLLILECFVKGQQTNTIQEVFHVYLNKFENFITHLFLVIFSNNCFPWVSMISRNTQSSRKLFMILFSGLKQALKMISQI